VGATLAECRLEAPSRKNLFAFVAFDNQVNTLPIINRHL
jgi:hypothetical protein